MQTLSFDVQRHDLWRLHWQRATHARQPDGVSHAEVTLHPGVATVVTGPGPHHIGTNRVGDCPARLPRQGAPGSARRQRLGRASKNHKGKHKKGSHRAVADGGGDSPIASAATTSATATAISPEGLSAQLHLLQVELVKPQHHFIGCGDRILVLLEGRDAAGKDGSIKRIVEYLEPARNPRCRTSANLPTRIAVAGTFSATSPSFRSPKNSFCSISSCQPQASSM